MSLKESNQNFEDDCEEDSEFPFDLSEWMIIDDDDDDDSAERGEKEKLPYAEVKESESKELPRQSQAPKEEKKDNKSNNRAKPNLTAVDKTQQQKNVTVKDLPKADSASKSTTAVSKKATTKPAVANNAKADSADKSKLSNSGTPTKKAIVTQKAGAPVSVTPARPNVISSTSPQPSVAQKFKKPQVQQTVGASSVKSPKSPKQRTLVTGTCTGKLATSTTQSAAKVVETKSSTATASRVSKSASAAVKPAAAAGSQVGKCPGNPTAKSVDSVSPMKTASKQASASNTTKSDSLQASTKAGNIVTGAKGNVAASTPSAQPKQARSGDRGPLSTKMQATKKDSGENAACKATPTGERKLIAKKSVVGSTTTAIPLSATSPASKGIASAGTKPTTSVDSQKNTLCSGTNSENRIPKKATPALHEESKQKKAGATEEKSAAKLAPSTKAESKEESYNSNVISSIAEVMEMGAESQVYQVVDEYDSTSAGIGGMKDVEDISDTELADIMQYESKSSEQESKTVSQKRSAVDGASGPVSKKSRLVMSVSTDNDKKDSSSTVQATKRKETEGGAVKKVPDKAFPNAAKKVLKKGTDNPVSKTSTSSNKQIIKSSSPRLGDTKIPPVVTKPGKRIIRRFHRMTQTTEAQHKHKLAQCRIRVPSLDAPSKPSQNKSVQTWSQAELELNKASYLDVAVTPNALPDSVSPEMFNIVSSFNINNVDQRLFGTTTFEYGISLGQISSADVSKAPFRDSILKKAYAHSINFMEQDQGVVDLYFSDEDSFTAMLIQARKIRIGSRYLVFTIFKNLSLDERKQTCGLSSLKSTIVYDQNFLSSGFLTYMKAPAWNKPRVEETVTIHNIPEGIPLSFLSLIIPDAVTLEVEGEKQEITKAGCRVKMGMNRKNGSDQLLKLFHQIYINNEPLILSTAKTEADAVSQVKEIMDSNKLKRDEVNQRRMEAHSVLREVKATPRDINKDEKVDVKKEAVEVFMEVQDEPCLDRMLTGHASGSTKLGLTRASIKKTVVRKTTASSKKGAPRVLAKHVKMQDNQQDLSDISDSSDIGEDFGVTGSGRRGKAEMSEAAKQKAAQAEERTREQRSGNKIERDEYSRDKPGFSSKSNLSNRSCSPFSRAHDQHESWERRQNQYPQRGDKRKTERFEPRSESEMDRVGPSNERESNVRRENRWRMEEEQERFIPGREENRGKHVRQGRMDSQERRDLEEPGWRRSVEPGVEGDRRGRNTYEQREDVRNWGRDDVSNTNEDFSRRHQDEREWKHERRLSLRKPVQIPEHESGHQGSFREHNVSADFDRAGLYNRGDRDRPMELRQDRGSRDRGSVDNNRDRTQQDRFGRDERRPDNREREQSDRGGRDERGPDSREEDQFERGGREKRGMGSRDREQFEKGSRERERYSRNVQESVGDTDVRKGRRKMMEEELESAQNRRRPIGDLWKQGDWQRRDRSPLTRKVLKRRSASPRRRTVSQKSHISRRLSRSPPAKSFRRVTLVRRSASPKSRRKGSALSPISVGDDDEFSGGMWLSPPAVPGSSTSKKNFPPVHTDRKSSQQKDQWVVDKNVLQNVLSRLLTPPKQSGSEPKDPSSHLISGHRDPVQYLAKMRETYGSGVNFVSSDAREGNSTNSSELSPPGDGQCKEERHGTSEGRYRPLYQPKNQTADSDPTRNQDSVPGGSHRNFDPRPNLAGLSDSRGGGQQLSASNDIVPFHSGPPPIPPPVAPPLFTGPLSSQDKFHQMKAMAKQLAEDIISQQEPPQQGTWKAPPFSTAGSLQSGLGPSPSLAAPSFQTPPSQYSGPPLLSGPPMLGGGASQYTGPPTFSMPPPNMAGPPPGVVPASHAMGMPNMGMPPPNMGMPMAGAPLVTRQPAPQNVQTSRTFTPFVNDSVFF